MKMRAFSDTDSTPGQNHIGRLPVEILLQIFLSAYLTSEHYTRFQLPFNLVLVSSFWRKLVLNEPRFWTYTFYGKNWLRRQTTPPLQSFLFQLSQSGNLSLEIAIDLRWWSPLADILDQVIDALVPHKDRWASFSLQTNSDDGVMAGILVRIPEKLPELRELVLQCPEGWRISRFPRPLICPKLQVLRLQGMAPQHNALVVSALPSLASVSIADTSLRWSDWSTLLQHGPKLVELVLRNVDIGRAGDLGNVPPISMPHLERFALRLKTGRSGPTGTALLDPVVASFFAPKLHTLLVNVTGTGTTPPPNHTWQEAMPMLKTLVIQTEGDIDASVFQRCPHVSHISVSDSRLEGHPLARRILEHLADPFTGPLLDQLDTLTLLAMIPTYEGWEKFLSGKKLRICIDSVFEIAARKSMDTKNLQDREAAIEKLKAIVPVEICPIPKDDTWFSNRWRFGGDD